MKWRLDEEHYDSDAMVKLDVGTIVGDGCENQWRYPMTAGDKTLRGQPRPPSRAMTPLDEEAEAAWKKQFGGEVPERDPTKAVPITTVPRDGQGNIKTNAPAPPGQPNPAPNTPTEKQPLGTNVTKDDTVAKEDPALNRTPEQHKPSESKPAGTK